MTDQQKIDELLANLRKVESGQDDGFDPAAACTMWHRNPEGPEAADLIERLRADRYELIANHAIAVMRVSGERDAAVALLRMFDAHLGEDDAMWADGSTVSSEWIRPDGIRQSLTFGLFRQVRTFLQSIARETGK